MKKHVFIFGLCFIMGIFSVYAQEKCDTLKLKTIRTDYTQVQGGIYYKMNDGVIFNMDTISTFIPGIDITNISNDTFYKYTDITFFAGVWVYADTGLITRFSGNVKYYYAFDILPGDTFSVVIGLRFELNDIVSAVEEKGLTIEDIAYCHLLVGVSATQKDGIYTDSVIEAGMDTTLFYITRTPPPSIQETAQTEISVYPNPAQTQFTVTNTENANMTLYNLLGQEIKQLKGKEETTTIQTENLPQGIYLLKIEKGDAVLTKKVQIIR